MLQAMRGSSLNKLSTGSWESPSLKQIADPLVAGEVFNSLADDLRGAVQALLESLGHRMWTAGK